MILKENQGIKVLRAGASWHGGSHVWSLPQSQPDGIVTPGAWTPAVRPLLRSSGWHLTTEPARWWGPDGAVRAYLAEWDGAVARTEGEDKFAVERCRLLRELTSDELASCGVFTSGVHEVRASVVWAWGSATVEASGSATVVASGSATVVAWGSATVRASGSATVRAWGSATVRAWGSATVRASDSATVEASGSATVEASDSAKAHAAGQSVATAWGSAVVVTRADYGVIVDRRGDTPRTVCKRSGLDGWRYADGVWSQRKAKRGAEMESGR